ncbi:MAG: Na+/H+ antiporter [Frankiaceae bacterium]|nr:Na+/H+ antiporter [Frankiaceae bacterium]MBV9870807.1 Na+/H+ antiporter [Frankiaceae bacterium]
MKAHVALALAALASVLLAELVARRLRLPSAVILVVVGLAYGELPGPNLTLDPAVVLTLILPPLLYSTALRASLVDIRTNLRSVASLSIGLTLATTFAVAGLVSLVVPDLPFSLAVALGAAVAPPDPVASLAIGRRAGLPPHLTTLVEGEGLLNDATALTTYQVAVASAVGSGLSPFHAVGTFALEALGGLGIGLAIALVVRVVRRAIDDPLVGNGLSLGVPFATYIAAESIHASGVLAVVVAGLMLGHPTGGGASGSARLQTRSVWLLLDFLLEGFVFLLIGQQLPQILDGLDQYGAGRLAAASLLTVGGVLVVRPLWLLLARQLPRRLRGGRALTVREVAATSWAGTRGVITLAAVFALPLTAHGAALPYRDLMLFCAYVVVLVTLVGQGLTFGLLLAWLKLPVNSRGERRTRLEARLAAAKVAAAQLDELCVDDGVASEVAARVRRAAQTQIDRAEHNLSVLAEIDDAQIDVVTGEAARLRHFFIDAQREELVRWRDAGRLSDRGLRDLEKELDVEESRLSV